MGGPAYSEETKTVIPEEGLPDAVSVPTETPAPAETVAGEEKKD